MYDSLKRLIRAEILTGHARYLGYHQSDLFKEFGRMVDTRLYPLGEAENGYYYLAIGENGRVYYLMEDIVLVGNTEDEALENLLIGRRVT